MNQDNLAIVRDRIVENAKVNPKKYGLVKQIGPYDVTPMDVYNFNVPPTRPRRSEFLQPDATPNGVKDELSWLPILLGGGFSMENGSVVQESIYDARITAPGQKVRGFPMEGPGILKAIQSVIGSGPQTRNSIAPAVPGQMAPAPTNTPTPLAPTDSEPQWSKDLKNWVNLRERQKIELIKKYAGGNEKAFLAVIPKFSEDEKTEFATAMRRHFDRVNSVPPACVGRGRPCTAEERELEIYWNKKFEEVSMTLLGLLWEMIF